MQTWLGERDSDGQGEGHEAGSGDRCSQQWMPSPASAAPAGMWPLPSLGGTGPPAPVACGARARGLSGLGWAGVCVCVGRREVVSVGVNRQGCGQVQV